MRTELILFTFLCFSAVAGAQKFQDYRSRFQYHLGGGFSTAFNDLFIDMHTDNLVQYDRTAPSGRLISLSYFPAKRWGVNFSLEATERRICSLITYLLKEALSLAGSSGYTPM